MPDRAEQPRDLKSALHVLGDPKLPWYLVLDAAQEPPALPAAHEAGVGTTCLYTGDFGRRLEEVAPHLASFDPASPFTEWLHRHWQSSHGILLQSAAPFEEVRRHLKRFLLAKGPGGTTVRFRFYDPRVLRAFLPICTPKELAEFFGPVSRYLGAGRPGRSLMAFSIDRQRLAVRELPLSPVPAAPTGEEESRLSDLRVIVLDAVLGTPIERAAVVVEGVDRRSAVTAADGHVRFDRLRPGRYQVYSIDGTRREGRSSVDLGPDTEPVFLPCRVRPV